MFDEQPDGDPHGECVEEIHRLGKEVSELRAANNQWFALTMEIGRRVGCLASSFPDANNHILEKLPAVESRAGALGRIADALCEYVEDDAANSARYRWLRHNCGYSIRCHLFGGVGMHEHKDADLDALIDAQMTPRFANVSCSQCGQEFGPGDHGFSHCENHMDLTPNVFYPDPASSGAHHVPPDHPKP